MEGMGRPFGFADRKTLGEKVKVAGQKEPEITAQTNSAKEWNEGKNNSRSALIAHLDDPNLQRLDCFTKGKCHGSHLQSR